MEKKDIIPFRLGFFISIHLEIDETLCLRPSSFIISLGIIIKNPSKGNNIIFLHLNEKQWHIVIGMDNVLVQRFFVGPEYFDGSS